MLYLRLNIDNINDPFAYDKQKTYATCKCEKTKNNERSQCKWHFNRGKERVRLEFRFNVDEFIYYNLKIFHVYNSSPIKGHMYKMPAADCAITQRKQASIYRMGYRQGIL